MTQHFLNVTFPLLFDDMRKTALSKSNLIITSRLPSSALWPLIIFQLILRAAPITGHFYFLLS
jgi:hypothetical protein